MEKLIKILKKEPNAKKARKLYGKDFNKHIAVLEEKQMVVREVNAIKGVFYHVATSAPPSNATEVPISEVTLPMATETVIPPDDPPFKEDPGSSEYERIKDIPVANKPLVMNVGSFTRDGTKDIEKVSSNAPKVEEVAVVTPKKTRKTRKK